MKDAILHAPFVRRVTKNLTSDEESMIAAAEMPERKPVPDDLLWETRDRFLQNRKVLIEGVCIAVVVMLAGLLLGAYKYSIAVGITAAVCGIAAIVLSIRSKIDDSATMMQIPIHHIDSGLTGSYAVCYLPDGKYELRLSGDSSFANALIIVQYNRMTTWQAVHHNDDVPAPSTMGLDEDAAEETAHAEESPAAETAEQEET